MTDNNINCTTGGGVRWGGGGEMGEKAGRGRRRGDITRNIFFKNTTAPSVRLKTNMADVGNSKLADY